MRRREFIFAVGGASLWPLAALGQQSRLRVVGVLRFSSLEAARSAFTRRAPRGGRTQPSTIARQRRLLTLGPWTDQPPLVAYGAKAMLA